VAGWALGVHQGCTLELRPYLHSVYDSSSCSADASAKRCVRLHLFLMT
jgi:hypothetical protein